MILNEFIIAGWVEVCLGGSVVGKLMSMYAKRVIDNGWVKVEVDGC